MAMKYKVEKNFYDSEDILKSEPKGRHYIVGHKKRGFYPQTQRVLDEERVKYLQEKGAISSEPIEKK